MPQLECSMLTERGWRASSHAVSTRRHTARSATCPAAEARAVVLLLAEGEELVLAATAGQVDSRAVGTRIPHAATAIGEVLERGRAERVADVAARLALDEERLGVVGAETGLLVPVAYRGSRLGVLAAFDRLEGAPGFGDEEQSVLEAFAASAAIAVATAQSVEHERLRHSLEAAERERRHWARELHDETLQGLGGLRMLLSSGRKSDDPAALQEVVDTAIEQLGRDIESLRTLITELRPAALDELGLAPAIESLISRVSAVEGLDVDLQLDVGDRRLSPEVETSLLDEVVVERVAHQLGPCGHAELALDRRAMRLDGSDAEEELLGDLRV